MTAAATAEEIARRVSVGLLVVHDGDVEWRNDAAEALVARHGGAWVAGAEPLALLAGVRPGAAPVLVRWATPAGDVRLWHVTGTALADERVLCEVVDRSAREGAGATGMAGMTGGHWRLDRLEALARMGSWVWDVAEDRIEWSDALLAMFGMPRGATLTFAAFRRMVHPEDLPAMESAMAEGMAACRPFTYTHRMRVAGGAERVFECHGELLVDEGGVPLRVLGTARDVTEEHRARAELAYLAEHDPLTGIANRRRFTARLAECAADPAGATLLLIDIDRFKDVNDLRGHAVGDRVMRRVAAVVAERLDPGALLGRLGGDEFAVVLPGADARRGMALARRLCAAVAEEPVPVDAGPPLRVTVSVGVAGLRQDDEVAAGLARADLALYAAKDAGRNRARLFSPDQYRRAVARVGLLQRVGDALDGGAMELDAQPIVELATGHPERSELLIRLRDGLSPELGPADFLPAAERTDLVLRLDRWVLARAVRALATDRARECELRLEVNISARSLEDDELGDWVLAELAAHRVEPHRLGLEMTETTAITNLDAAQRLVGRLTGAGCGFSLDDFGAGFGSFSHLKHLPFTAVKIAGEFVRQVDSDPVDRALVSAVVGVARELGMRTVAEQVDRPELVAVLQELGVHDGQGFHLGRPRPLAALLGRAAGQDRPGQSAGP
jgi:diguanylate cyclase (GGDEF)-like protein/PAS domain S-box-containing protein